MTIRYALYAVPAAGHPLWQAASAWLGRDAETGAEPAPILPPWLEREHWREITAEPRRYGFHGTLKPPMTLAAGETSSGLEAALAEFAAGQKAPPPVRLEVAAIAGFVALLPAPPAPALMGLADLCVEHFDRFRAPAAEAELARRRQAGLSPVQDAHLLRWGYPYVFDQFRYHMTLSGRLHAPERDRVIGWLRTSLGPVLKMPVPIELGLFVQEHADRPFHAQRRFAFSAY
jgi:putative phosphonate metabolism protein